MNRRAWRAWSVGWLIWFGWLIWTAWACAHPDRWIETPAKRHALSFVALGQFLLPMVGVWGLVSPGRRLNLMGRLLLLAATVVVPALIGFIGLAGWAGWASGWTRDVLRAGGVMVLLAGSGVLVGMAIRSPNGVQRRRRTLLATRVLAFLVFSMLLFLAAMGSRGPEEAFRLMARLSPYLPLSSSHPDPFPMSQQIKPGAPRGPGSRGWFCSVSDPRFEILPDRLRIYWSVEIVHWQPRGWLKPPSRRKTWIAEEPPWVGMSIERTLAPPEGFYRWNSSGREGGSRSGLFVHNRFTRTDFFRLITSQERRSLTSEEVARLHSLREATVREWARQVQFTFTTPPRPPWP